MSCGERFEHVVRHIEANLFEPLSVGGLAAVAGLVIIITSSRKP